MPATDTVVYALLLAILPWAKTWRRTAGGRGFCAHALPFLPNTLPQRTPCSGAARYLSLPRTLACRKQERFAFAGMTVRSMVCLVGLLLLACMLRVLLRGCWFWRHLHSLPALASFIYRDDAPRANAAGVVDRQRLYMVVDSTAGCGIIRYRTMVLRHRGSRAIPRASSLAAHRALQNLACDSNAEHRLFFTRLRRRLLRAAPAHRA